jgi:hypothetical protein
LASIPPEPGRGYDGGMEYIVRATFIDGAQEIRVSSPSKALEAAASYERLGATSTMIVAPNGTPYGIRVFQRAMTSGVITDA